MTALEKVQQVKEMQFFEDKRSLEAFIADWERRLYSNDFDWLPIELRAMELCKAFVKLGYMKEEELE